MLCTFVFIRLVWTASTCILVLQTTRDKSINYTSWDGSIRLLEGTGEDTGVSCRVVVDAWMKCRMGIGVMFC